MEHTYLLRPAAGGRKGPTTTRRAAPFPWAGETELVQEGRSGIWTAGWRCPGPAPVRFTNRYVIRETDRPFTLTWQSFNPVLGVLEGTFELAGESILSRYVSPGPGVLRL